MRNLTAALLLLCTTFPSITQAQIYPPRTFSIGGYPFACGNAFTFVTPMINDLGKAAPGRAIWLHPMLNNHPVGVIAFVFTHECAHFMGQMNEQAADVQAIQLGKRQGWLTRRVLQQICRSVYMSPGDWTHFPGPARCRLMFQAWSSV